MIHALDIDVDDHTDLPLLYKKADTLLETAKRNFPQSQIIISGLPRYRDSKKEYLREKLESHIRQKISDPFSMCLLDNTGLALLKDDIHLTGKAREALGKRLAKLLHPR